MAEEGGNGVKDVTVTSFGLIIAYLLPGLVGLYGLSFWSQRLSESFATFLTAESNVGLFLILILGSLVIGMVAHGVRWILFEVWFCGPEYKFAASDFADLAGEGKLSAFRGAVDEIYRYHQWWGGLTVVAPLLFFGAVHASWLSRLGWPAQIGSWCGFLALEALTSYAAKRVHQQYIMRVKSILKGV